MPVKIVKNALECKDTVNAGEMCVTSESIEGAADYNARVMKYVGERVIHQDGVFPDITVAIYEGDVNGDTYLDHWEGLVWAGSLQAYGQFSFGTAVKGVFTETAAHFMNTRGETIHAGQKARVSLPQNGPRSSADYYVDHFRLGAFRSNYGRSDFLSVSVGFATASPEKGFGEIFTLDQAQAR